MAESHLRQGIPPAAGSGKQWRMRTLEWRQLDPNRPGETADQTVIIPRGTPVHEKCRDAYWQSRDGAVQTIEAYRNAGIEPPYPYLLANDQDVIVGYGAFHAADDADDMAWIACMFLELRLRLGFAVPEA